MTDATTVQVSASGDTLIVSTSPTSNFGTLATLQERTGKVSTVVFDLSAIPVNASVTSSKVLLTCNTGTNGVSTELHRMLRPWTELGATWNTYDGTSNWATAGAANSTIDYNSTVLATFTWTSIDDQIEIAVPTSIVESWVNGSASNYGFRISPTSATELRFHSREAATAGFRPLLEISYTTPLAYQINSTAINAGIQANWLPISTGSNSDATQKLSTNWRRHTWSSAFMEMTEWLVLLALRGTSFTELKTTNESTPNSTGTYSTGRVMTVTGNQIGRRMAGVKVEFLVDITS